MDDSQNFSKRIDNVLSGGYLSLALAIGEKHGLCKALMDKAFSKANAMSSTTLAQFTNCKERYVREWLCALVCGELVDHEVIDGEDKYWIDEYKHTALLQGCVRSKLFSSLAATHTLVSNCFPVDGPAGTSVDDHPATHQFLADLPGVFAMPTELQKILDFDPQLSKLFKSGAKVLEVGCGAGNPTKHLSKLYPDCSFTATDLSAVILESAKANCEGLLNVSFQVLDACNVPDEFDSQYDIVILADVFHDVPFPDKLASGLSRTLKPGGILLLIDIPTHSTLNANKQVPLLSCLYMISTLYCVPTSLSTEGSLVLGACAGAEKMMQILSANGFSEVKRVPNLEELCLIGKK